MTVDDVLAKLPPGIFALRARVAQVLAIVGPSLAKAMAQRDEALRHLQEAYPYGAEKLRRQWGLATPSKAKDE